MALIEGGGHSRHVVKQNIFVLTESTRIINKLKSVGGLYFSAIKH